MAITLSDANRMVGAAIREAENLGINLSVAVCDAGGIYSLSTEWKALYLLVLSPHKERPSGLQDLDGIAVPFQETLL